MEATNESENLPMIHEEEPSRAQVYEEEIQAPPTVRYCYETPCQVSMFSQIYSSRSLSLSLLFPSASIYWRFPSLLSGLPSISRCLIS